MEVCKTYEGIDYDKIYEAFPKLRNTKLEINIMLFDRYKDMLENPDFEQNLFSKTAKGIYKTGHDSNRLMNRLAYNDRSCYLNINYYDSMGSILKYIKELS